MSANRRSRGLPACPFKPPYNGLKVRVGEYLNQVRVGGAQYLSTEDLDKGDVLIPLLGCQGLNFGGRYRLRAGQEPHLRLRFRADREYDVLCGKLEDFGGVPDGWENFLRCQVIPLLMEGKNILAFCYAGQGRTGTFLASLVAILEPGVPDPIEEVRHRYSECAVETVAQAKAIFAIAGKPMPAKYLQLH